MAQIRSLLLSSERPLFGFDTDSRAHAQPDGLADYDDDIAAHLGRLGRPLRWAWGQNAEALDHLRRFVAATCVFDAQHPLTVLPEGALAASTIVNQLDPAPRKVLVTSRLEPLAAALATEGMDVTVLSPRPAFVVGLEGCTIFEGDPLSALPAAWAGQFDAVIADTLTLGGHHTLPLVRLATLCAPDGRVLVVAHRQESFALRFEPGDWGIKPLAVHNDVLPRLTPSLEVPDVFWDLWVFSPESTAQRLPLDRPVDPEQAQREEPDALSFPWGEQVRGFSADVDATAHIDPAVAAFFADLDPAGTVVDADLAPYQRRHLSSAVVGDTLVAVDNEHQVVTLALTHWGPQRAQALANLIRAYGPPRSRFVDPASGVVA